MNKIYTSLSLSIAVLAGATLAHAEAGFTYLDDQAEAGGYDVTATMQKLPVELSLSEQANGDGYRLRVTPDGAQFGLETHGAFQAFTTMQGHLDPGALVAQRRGAMWRIITGKRVVLEAEDDHWHEGKIGFRGDLKDSRVQPMEDIYFDDDFMRVASDVAMAVARTNPHEGVVISQVKVDETLWKPVVGIWNTTGLSENEQAQVAQSANPFAFRTNAPGTDLAITGRPFWDNYVMSASLRPEGATAIGIAMYVQDAKNYLLFHWQANGPMQLRAVVNGQTRILDQADGSYEPKQWYRVRFSNADGFLRVYVDDTEVLRAHTQLFGRGPAGVYAEIPAPPKLATPGAADATTSDAAAVFDDVSIRSMHDVQDDFKVNVPGRWQTVSGAWRLAGTAQPADAHGAFAVLGEADWKDYVTSAQIVLPADAAAGLVLDHQTGKGAYLLRVAGSKSKLSFAGKAQIVKLGKGTSTVLGEAPIGSRFDGKTMDWSFAAERGYLKAMVNGARIVDAFDESLPGGRAGIFAERGAQGVPALATFGVSFPVTKATWAKVPELYDLDMQAQTMGGWSTPEGFWVNDAPVSTIANTTSSTGSDANVRWHKGTFWGDGSVRFNLPALDAKQELKLMFDNVQAASTGHDRTVTLSLKANAGVLTGSIMRSGTVSKVNHWDGTLKLDGPVAGQPIEVEQRGSFIIVRVGKPATAHTLLVAHLV